MVAACGNNTTTSNEDKEVAAVEIPTPAVITEEPTGDSTKADNIVISKQTMTLRLYDSDGALICTFPVATGKHAGNKQRPGDMKTPEGEFTVEEVVPAAHWTHDFGDGKGVIEGCYGNWFIRLKTPPHRGIGIHGTHDPASIGTRATEGCIRLENNDLDSLKPMVHAGMRVTIEAGDADLRADGREIASATHTEPTPVVSSMPEVTAPAEGATPIVEAPASSDDDDAVWHTVVDGDLVGRIAKRYGTTSAKIAELNPDINIDRIAIGQRIKVRDDGNAHVTENTSTESPAPAPTTEGGDEVWHTVVDGDLVGRIAKQYGTTSAKIAELNPDINIDRISIGQRIRVK